MPNETPAPPPPAPVAAPPARSPALADVTFWLTDEIAETHAVIMGLHKFAAVGKDPMVQLNFMKAAVRMMQVQAAAALTLQRLMGGKAQTITIIHEKRNTPPPEKSKTNRRPPLRPGIEEVWEDEEGVKWTAPPGTPGRRGDGRRGDACRLNPHRRANAAASRATATPSSTASTQPKCEKCSAWCAGALPL